jgi:hypothetical protein
VWLSGGVMIAAESCDIVSALDVRKMKGVYEQAVCSMCRVPVGCEQAPTSELEMWDERRSLSGGFAR